MIISDNQDDEITNCECVILESLEDLTYIDDPSKMEDTSTFSQIFSLTITNKSKENVLKAINYLSNLYFVQCAEPSYIYETVDLWTPNDVRYSNQWGLNHIDISNAWNFSIGNTNPRIKVGIFENNIQANHEDLSVITGNFTPDPSDSAEHGTHVAGIIGAISDNLIGISGIAQVDIALLDRGNFVSSICWAINNDIRVVNASFYYGYIDSSDNKILTAPSNSHAEAIENFGNAGGIFVASAGNSGNTTLGNLDNTPEYPGGYGDSRRYPNINNVITVGALNQDGGRRASSNYGVNSVHIYAPGENIISTLPGNSYGIDSGTSMAAPHVAGVAALMLSINPNISAEGLRNAILNNSETVSIQVPTVAGGTTFTSQNVRSLNALKAVTSVAFNTSSNDNGITLEGLTNNFNFFDGSQLVLPNSFTQYGRPLASEHQNIIGIGVSCFENNKVIENITLPPKVNIIGSYSFKNCRNLQTISIPNTVTNIDSSAFENCSYLQSVTLPTNLVAIGSSAFKGCGSLASITIPNGVTNIDSSAFENCSYLQSVILPTNLVAIGSSAFKGCGSLGSITIPNGVTNIDSSAFENCSYLQAVTLPANLVAIGTSAFKGCGSLGNVTIPSNVQYIDDSAFENCVSLVSVVVEREISNITNLGNYAFAGCSSTLQIIVPKNRIAEYKNKVYWSSYRSKIIPDNSSYSEIELYCLIDKDESVTLNAGYNKLYKVVVDCTRSYKFETDASSKIIVYNSDMTVAYSGNNSLPAYLNKGSYYLSIEHSTVTTSGTIKINYEPAYNPDGIAIAYNSSNGTNIASGLHLTDNNIYHARLKYTNYNGAGFYKFTLNAGASAIYPVNAIQVYTDANRTNLLSMYSLSELDIFAQSNENENIMYIYLPENGTYYIDVTLPLSSYSTLTFNIQSIEVNNINYLNSLTSIDFDVLFENVNTQSCFEEVTISHRSEIQLDIISSGTIYNDIKVYVFEKVRDPGYEPGINYYYIESVYIDEITSTNRSPVFTLILDPGTYYFGYAENEDNVNINFALRRMVDYNMNMQGILVADPYYTGYDLGTEVLFNSGECDEYTITEGFTRNIYLMVEDRLRDPMSRLDYDWYSSNENVAIVTNYGTVLAMPVTEDTTVTIYAVLKDDPKVVYYRTFTVLNDEEEDLIEIELNMSYSYVAENGTYQLELTNTNCPYPMIQYYSWNILNESEETVTMNYWGQISSTGICTVLIVGTYNLNSRVRLYITLIIE